MDGRVIAAHLLEALECCMPPDDRTRPVLREPTPEVEEPRDVEPPRARPVTKVARPVADAVIAILRASPCISAKDVTLALRARGHRAWCANVGKVLKKMHLDGRVLRTGLTGRDARRAGAQFVWAVAP